MLVFTPYGHIEIGSVEGLTDEQIDDVCRYYLENLKREADLYGEPEEECYKQNLVAPTKIDDEIPF